ncbi:unnamed protein product, partial [marine sediment metagenome]
MIPMLILLLIVTFSITSMMSQNSLVTGLDPY